MHVRFRDLDDVEVNNVKTGGERKSKHCEKWAENAFNEWRKFQGYFIEKSIADMSEEVDVKPFVGMLYEFILQLTKTDGSLYPPKS
jgi:hypothetical protein